MESVKVETCYLMTPSGGEGEEGAVTVKTTQEEVKLADVKFLVSFVLSRS